MNPPGGAVRIAWRVAREIVTSTFVEPVAEGRLRPELWPRGLRPIAVLTTIAYIAAALVALFADQLRTVDVLTRSVETGTAVPRMASWSLMVVLVLALALMQTAALHCAWYLKLPALLVSAIVLLLFGIAVPAPGPMVSLAGFVVLVIFMLVRWRAQFAWWEFVFVSGLMLVTTQLPFLLVGETGRQFGFDPKVALVVALLEAMMMLAIPALMASGASVAQITVKVAESVTRALKDELPRVGWILLIVAVVGWRTAELVLGVIREPPNIFPLLTSALLVAVAGALCWGLLAAHRDRAQRLRVQDFANDWSELIYPVAAVLTGALLILLPLVLFRSVTASLGLGEVTEALGWAQAWSRDPLFAPVMRTAVAVGAAGVAVRLARKGRLMSSVLLLSFSVGPLFDLVAALTGFRFQANLSQVSMVGTVVGLLTLAGLALTRQWSRARMAGPLLILVLCGIFPHRELISDPATSLLGFSAAAVLLFGLVWRLLTDGEIANRTSRAFPLPSRVLLYLANSVLAVALVAFVALSRTRGDTLDIDRYADSGDWILGTPLLVGMIVLGLFAGFGGLPDMFWADRTPEFDEHDQAGHPPGTLPGQSSTGQPTPPSWTGPPVGQPVPPSWTGPPTAVPPMPPTWAGRPPQYHTPPPPQPPQQPQPTRPPQPPTWPPDPPPSATPPPGQV